MSTKTSPTTVRDTSSVVGGNPAGSVGGIPGGVVQIKKEVQSDEIKEYAHNTMNELLGWYGFDGVDRLDLSAKTSRLLQSAAAAAANQQQKHQQHQQQQQQHHHHHHHLHHPHLDKKRSSRSRTLSTSATSLLHQHQQPSIGACIDPIRSITNNSNKNNNNNNNNNNNSSSNSGNRKVALNSNSYRSSGIAASASSSAAVACGAGAGGGGGNESTNSDHDTRSSREDDSKSPHSVGRTTIEEKIDFNNCCWCHRPIPENAPDFLTSCDGPRYCSESCFTQSRRASFKKAKTCDWCKHVRHAVSYVDFQDGASQLQFCSEKCLNQYKMEIFCNETRAHLDMNPHLREQGLEAAAAGNGAGLITPDLWLRNCRSRSASPASTISVSPGPASSACGMGMGLSGVAPCGTPTPVTGSMSLKTSSPCITPPACTVVSSTAPNVLSERPKPLISVAPVAKLMSKSPNMLHNRPSPKHNRKKRPQRSEVSAMSASSSAAAGSAAMGHSVGSKGNAVTVASLLKAKAVSCSLMPPSNTLSHFAGSSVQDLHMSVPPLSPMIDSPQPQHHHLPQHQHHHQQQQQPPQPPPGVLGHGRATSIPAAYFATPPLHAGMPSVAAASQSSAFQPRPNFLPGGMHPGMFPRFMPGIGGFPQLPPPTLPQPAAADVSGLAALLGTPPPVTVMVPYPVIIPLPIPIPVPLPVVDFYKAYMTRDQREQYDAEQAEAKRKCPNPPEKMEPHDAVETEQPLDFTTTKESDSPLLNVEEEDFEMKPTTPEPQADASNSASTPNSELCKYSTNSPTTSEPSGHETHCIVQTEELPSSVEAGANDPNANALNAGTTCDVVGGDEEKQKLPKFKITRLQSKRTLLQTKETLSSSSNSTSTLECSRPLRKRKRIIDCDFQKIALKEAETNETEEEKTNNNNTISNDDDSLSSQHLPAHKEECNSPSPCSLKARK